MNIMELGAIGEMVGGLAVVGSLFYVGLQLRQNTRQLKSQARFQVFESLNQNTVRLAGSEQFELVRAEATTAHPMQFSDEGDRFQFIWTSWLSHAEMLYYELEDGTLPLAFEKTLRFRLATCFGFDRARSLWALHRHYFTDAFQEYVAAQLQSNLGDEFTHQAVSDP